MLQLDASGQLNLSELSNHSDKKSSVAITLLCDPSLIQCFAIDCHLDGAEDDLSLQKLLLERQMQKQYQIDLKQCYYDWRALSRHPHSEDEGGEKQGEVQVYVISRAVIDQAIVILPVQYQKQIVAICPLTPLPSPARGEGSCPASLTGKERHDIPHPTPLQEIQRCGSSHLPMSLRGLRANSVAGSGNLDQKNLNISSHEYNLWPWRDIQYQHNQRQWVQFLIAACVIALGVLLLGRTALQQLSSDQYQQETTLEHNYEAKILKLQQHIQAIERQQKHAHETLQWFQWVGNHWPLNVKLTHWQFEPLQMQLDVHYQAQSELQTLLDQFADHPKAGRYSLNAHESTEQSSGYSKSIVIDLDSGDWW